MNELLLTLAKINEYSLIVRLSHRSRLNCIALLLVRNVVLHVVTSWPIAWASLCIGGAFLPFSFQLMLIALKCILCIIQEPPIGVS